MLLDASDTNDMLSEIVDGSTRVPPLKTRVGADG